jgi:transcriptional regulator with XRE-family HTH domain
MTKTMAYTAGIEHNRKCIMPKTNNDELQDFGRRLAAFRKTAGFTQLELGDEVGVSRRTIAYYETQTQHPPTTLLPKLALALGVTTDELLNVNGNGKTGSQQISNRMQRKLQQIEKLGPKEKRQAMQMLDMFIEREQLKRQA